jgi:hypothetical protein
MEYYLTCKYVMDEREEGGGMKVEGEGCKEGGRKGESEERREGEG